MDLPSSLFSPGLMWLCWALAGGLLGFAVSRIPWKRLDPQALNAWMGACVVVMALWLLKGGLQAGLSFHVLGAAVLTLLMGPWLALLGMALVQAAQVAGGHGDWLALGINILLAGALPVGVVAGILSLALRWLPAQLFVYVFVNAFMAGGISLFASACGGMLVMGIEGSYPWDILLQDTLPFYFLMSWSEAFTTGLVMAILIVYRPQWVATFDDGRYLGQGPGADGS